MAPELIPPAGFLKCTIDAAFREEALSFSSGLCVRDETGQFLQAKTWFSPFIPAAHEGEALNLLEAIKWLQQLDV